MRIDYTINEQYNGKTVLSVLKGQMKLSGRLITKLKTSNGILLNHEHIRTIDPVHIGDVISVILDFVEETNVIPEHHPLSIIYEDDCFLAVDKMPNTAVHPTAGYVSGTLANFVMAHFIKQGLNIKIRPINRLDRDTTGIVLFAKNPHVQEQIIRQMKNNKVLRCYLAVVHGTFEPKEGLIDLPIDRKEGSTIERVVDASGENALTRYKTLNTAHDMSLVQFILETGRTHQIRVHASTKGHPIIGDWLYSTTPTDLINRQALHAHILAFDHPITNKRITLEAPIPEDVKRVLAKMQIPF